MKRFLLFLIAFAAAGQLLFAGDLFFSEYIEASVGNNKALEIYNPTGEPVDLSHYTVKAANNGSGWGCYTPSGGEPTEDSRYILPLSGTLNSGDVFVIYNIQAVPAITSVGDLGFAYNSTPNGGNGDNVPTFNGNDALGLFKDNVLIDVIGIPTSDPGTGWDIAGVTAATKDHTLVRKSTIGEGNTDWASSAGTTPENSEWIVYDDQTYSYLGAHIYEGAGNIAPIARAGSDKVARFGETVTLDGSASKDPDGSIISYVWTQVAGTSVTLSATDQAVVSFTAPDVVSEFSFELVVTDNEDAVGKDTITVYVDPSQIIISEYVEGSSYNKYIEIYNASESPIDLAAEGYDLRKVTDGNGTFSETFNNWGDFSLLASGATIVLGNSQATIYPNVDITNNNVINFNGNDAVGLFRDGNLVDVVGDPTNAEYIIQDKTLRRKNTVVYGNTTYTVDEWEEFEKDNVENLGIHSTNPYAPAISSISHMPAFVTSANEIEVSAIITPQVGTISSLVAKYGSSGSLINESTDSWEDDPDQHIWKVLLPTQPGNSRIEFKLVATDSEGNIGESTVQSFLVAGNLTDIADIHANIDALEGTIISIEGIITIGAGKLRDDRTDCYVQDESGRGLNLYSSEFHNDLERGTEVKVVGYAELYYTTVEITDFSYQVVSTNNDLPAPKSVSIAGANSDDNEGSWIQFYGELAERITMTDGSKLLIADGSDTTAVMIWNTTGVDVAALTDGESYWYRGVGSQYSGEHQLLVAYDEDIRSGTGINDDPIRQPLTFRLEPAYPNPFNPTTTIAWQLAQVGDFRLSLFNLLGQEVAVLATGKAKPGKYSTLLHAEQMHSGMYFVRLESDGNVATQKIILLK
ncbi:MAG TPA: T9SS type A sorting domain-containing protein [Candidatus Marinimicrobia bacterium]|nr:T9SS type A sorting domain-containing protein [Candidatus Neomarinimicrobiota bacterium]